MACSIGGAPEAVYFCRHKVFIQVVHHRARRRNVQLGRIAVADAVDELDERCRGGYRYMHVYTHICMRPLHVYTRPLEEER